jgi:RND family efflux transporter MFP subunit
MVAQGDARQSVAASRDRAFGLRGRRVNQGGSSIDLLQQLRIERDQRDDDAPRSRWPWLVLALVIVLALAAGGWWWAQARATQVQTVTAVAPAAGDTRGAVLQATGYVVARRRATVSAQIVGKLTAVDIEEGDHVKKGQILARLDPTEFQARLDSAQANYAAARAGIVQAKAGLTQDEADAKRLKTIVGRGYVSRQVAQQAATKVATDRAAVNVAIKQAQAAKAQVDAAQISMDFTIVRAPFAGVVTDKAAQVGEIIAPAAAGGGFTRTGVATIVDMNSLEVDVDVNEAYISRVKPGMPVEAVLDAYPDWKIPAHVIAIIPSADKSKATVKVRIALEKKDPRIIPQMGVRVSFLEAKPQRQEKVSGVLVPKTAIVARDGRTVVFVARDDRAHAVEVSPATGDYGDLKRLRAGMAAGTKVIDKPPADLAEGDRIKVEKSS